MIAYDELDCFEFFWASLIRLYIVSKNFSLSIIIPVYNEESHLRQCLDAIAKQIEKPDEVIVVDNNSTDETVQIAKSFSFVKVLVAE